MVSVLIALVALVWLLWPRLPINRGFAPQRFAAPPAPTDAAWRVAERTLAQVPRSGERIASENAGQLTEAARWGGGQTRALRYSPDGALIAVESDLGIYLYDGESLELARWIQTEYSVDTAAFSPDSAILAVVVNHRIQLRSVADGNLIRTLEGHNYIQQLAFSPDGTLLASAAWDGTIRLWSVGDGSLVRTLTGHTDDNVWSVAFHPAGTHVASAGSDGTVRIWRVADGAQVRSFGKPFLLDVWHTIGDIDGMFVYYAVTFSPDGRRLVASSSSYTYVWAFPGGRLVYAMETPSALDTLTFGANGMLFNRSGDQWDLGRRQLVRAIDRTTFEPMSVAPSPDGSRVTMLQREGRIAVWDTSDGAFRMAIRPEEPEALAFHSLLLAPDGEMLIAGDEAGRVQLRHLPEGELHHVLGRESNRVTSVALSPDGTLVAGGSWHSSMTVEGESSVVTVWRVSDGAALYELRGHDWVEDLEFSPDGRFLATAGADEENSWPIRIWDMADGRLLHELHGHEFTVEALRFVEVGCLLSASSDDTVRLWDLSSGELIETREGFRFFNDHEFSPDGTVLAGKTGDYTVELRRVSDGELLHELDQSDDGEARSPSAWTAR